MKFGLAGACTVALAAALSVLTAVAAAASPGFVNTTVNLRQGPTTTTPVIAKIPAGSRVNVTTCSGGWCQVAFAGKSGYVIATALGPGAPPPGYVPPPVYAVPPPYPYPYYGPYYYGYGPNWGWHGGWGWRGGWGRGRW